MMILSSCGGAEFQDVSADVKSESVSEECFTNPLSYIGKIHNDALDVISMTDVTIDSICDFAHNYVEVSFSDSGLMFGPEGAVIAATKEIVKGAIVGSGVNVVKGLIW